MRIVGGIYRGRALTAPDGRTTRPTTDRMRESIASMILSEAGLDLSGMHVLDAFAGSGGVGLELVSRGADHVTFFERDHKAASCVRANCEGLGLGRGAYTLVRSDVCRQASERSLPGGPFEIVFLDPPYQLAASAVSRLVADLASHGCICADGIVVYERDAKAAGLEVAGLELVRTRAKGTTGVDVYRMAARDEESRDG